METPAPLHRFTGEPLLLEIRDHLEHPLFEWPQSLVGWDIDFSAAPLPPGRILLRNADSAVPLPHQLGEPEFDDQGRILRARLHHFAALAPGERHRFEILEGEPPATETVSLAQDSAEGILLDTGQVRALLPTRIQETESAPPPLLRIGRCDSTLARGAFAPKFPPLEKFQAALVEEGSLYATAHLHYQFLNGGRFEMQVRAIRNYPFLQIEERMQGFPEPGALDWRIYWTDFPATHHFSSSLPFMHWPPLSERYGDYPWRRLGEPHTVIYRGEDPPFMGQPEPGHSEGELAYRLGPYAPAAAYRIMHAATFWDEATNHAAGLFIDRPEKWDDGQYATWASSDSLLIRFDYHQASGLRWRFPLRNGTRALSIACYDHARDEEVHHDLRRKADALIAAGATREDAEALTRLPSSYAHFLKNHYGTLPLDHIKDWQLHYPDDAPAPPVLFAEGEENDPDAYEARMDVSPIAAILTFGTRAIHAGTTYDPVRLRQVYDWMTDGYNRLAPRMTPRQRARCTAFLLLNAHVCAGEDLIPMRRLLGGHPNFLADVKSPLALAAFLFPEHPQATTWAEQFAKYIDLNGRVHVRPDVPAWQARGGRWTESPGIYVWAFLRPSILAAWSLWKHFDQRNPMATPEMAALMEYMAGILSAPIAGEKAEFFNSRELARPDEGPRRVYPPQGAHAKRRTPYRLIALMAVWMQRYRPLLAEKLFHLSRPSDVSMEIGGAEHPERRNWDITYDTDTCNPGMPSEFQSQKFTGYGLVLRAAVGTEKELSVHLQQIDRGPNYRWGFAGDGGCGAVYYYAHQKAYSHNGMEDAGDRHCADTDFVCNFGVWKDQHFKSIGRNTLHRPFHDLHFAQFAQLEARPGPDAYAWPEYQFRSLLLMGADYFLLHDAVLNEQVSWRFSWFTHPADPMPALHFIANYGKSTWRHWPQRETHIETAESRGVWHEGCGDSLVAVSHRDDLQVEGTPTGCRVQLSEGSDSIFLSQQPVESDQEGIRFQGRCGAVRRRADKTQLILCNSGHIAADGLSIEILDGEPGIALEKTAPHHCHGFAHCQQPARIRLAFDRPPATPPTLQLDGNAVDAPIEDGRAEIEIPIGRHAIHFGSETPRPIPPRIERTEYHPGAVQCHFQAQDAAPRHRLEQSSNGGESWSSLESTSASPLTAPMPPSGEKCLLRLVALAADNQEVHGPCYPLYGCDSPPPPPDGLRLARRTDTIHLDWGEVLGVAAFRLYGRPQGEENWQLLHESLQCEYHFQPADSRIYEYRIAAVNGFGEGPPSLPINDDPESWANFDPLGDTTFRRQTSYNLPPFAAPGDTPPPHYPQEGSP